ILTTVGEAYFAQAVIDGTAIVGAEFKIAVGDGNGQQYDPTPEQTSLLGERWRGIVNDIYGNPDNASQIVIEGIIPTNIGGWFIREWGVFNSDGRLIAVGSLDDTYKSQLSSGVGKQVVIQAILEVDNAAVLSIIVDDSVVLATKNYVDQKFQSLSAVDGLKYIGRCPDISTLRTINPSVLNQKIDVVCHSTKGDKGGGYFYYDDTDSTTIDDNGFTCVVLQNGKRWKREVSHDLYVEWSGIDTTGGSDVTTRFQQLLDISARFSKVANGMTTKAILHLSGCLKIAATRTIDASKVALEGPGQLYFDPAGVYLTGYAFLVTGSTDTPLASYSNKTTPIYQNIIFASNARATLDLFYGVNSTDDSNNNASALQTVSNCQFKGFRNVFCNGKGGWGWAWYACGANSCEHWMNITTQPDTYERYSFDSCIWQNGGYAFILDNPDGKIYWHKGSMDYCDGAAIITRGFLELNTHIEFSARTLPFIDFRGATAHAVVSGKMAVRLNTTTPYNVFKQIVPNQVTLKDIDISSDGINISSCILSNMPYLKTNINFTNDAAKAIALYDADSSLKAPGISAVEHVVTGTGLSSVINSDGSITLTSSVNAGGSKGLDFFVPITGHTQIGVEWFGSNTSTLSPVFVQKLLCTQVARTAGNGVASDIGLITDNSVSGTTSIAIGAKNVRGSSGTVWATPKSAFFLRLRFNADNIGIGESFTIHSIKLISC
ncbi:MULTISPECIES: phage tail protein, partial [unclassified Serratia (in: enterobacteria)]|uniref:phage tail protein n=1 Tax=unclassified Serratia (in: enterobacteria) TaxID=2647522 RepID=UPI0004A8262D